TDLPGYRIWQDGRLSDEVTDVTEVWDRHPDLVSFLIGCSFTFESGLSEAGIPIRHQEAGRNVPMYRTSTACAPAGRIGGDMVVSMRPIPAAQVAEAVRITDRFPAVHGAPVHIGEPGQIGIDDLASPDFGDPPVIAAGDIPVFWARGVTPQAATRPPARVASPPAAPSATAPRSTSADPARSESTTSLPRPAGTRRSSPQATSPCSGPAESPRRRRSGTLPCRSRSRTRPDACSSP